MEELDFKWPAKLKDLFEVDDNATEYPQPFADARLLMENFSNLEEKNLQLIRQCQDIDEQLDRKRDQRIKMERTFEGEIKELDSKVEQIEKKISRSR